ncbi:unnamed protein product [Hermetia illucens]|uniref:Calponin-homology (CH) domain-containing protein n=1 Tax=Hermetia illucens TaxID=343691 RepID=A0A7R8US73_HERIL|nr:unnamed protein product [Hermetia illucens]
MLGGCVGAQGSNENVASVSIYDYAKIYTDWANYYLERVRSKKKVTDLSTDCRDGLLLADVIEAVTTFKVPDLIKKPKNQQQMMVVSSAFMRPDWIESFRSKESIWYMSVPISRYIQQQIFLRCNS